MNATHLIEPERHGVWIVAAFVLGLIAVALCAVALYRINYVVAGTQAEILFLNKKIEQVKAEQAKSAAPAQPQAAPAAPAPAAPSK